MTPKKKLFMRKKIEEGLGWYQTVHSKFNRKGFDIVRPKLAEKQNYVPRHVMFILKVGAFLNGWNLT